MKKNKKDLIIGSQFGGLGDHLFLSPIPRLYKLKYPKSKVFLSYQSKFRSWEIYKLIWADNPYLDGLLDCEIDERITNIDIDSENLNMLEIFLKSLSLDIPEKTIVPEIYNHFLLKPIFKNNNKYELIDMNYISFIGSIRKKDIRNILKTNINDKSIIVNPQDWILKEFPTLRVIRTKSLYHYASLINYANKFIVLPSGGSHLALALNIEATVYFGYRFNKIFLNERNNNKMISKRNLLNLLISEYLQQKNLLRYDQNNRYIKEPNKIEILFRIIMKIIKNCFIKIKNIISL